MDSTGIPLSYDLFPGNESEKTSLLPINELPRGRAPRYLVCPTQIISIAHDISVNILFLDFLRNF